MGATAPLASPSRLMGEGVPTSRAALDAALLTAHAAGDARALGRLYTQAADAAEAGGATDAACFFLTQAYVFALSAGSSQAGALHARLLAHGREE